MAALHEQAPEPVAAPSRELRQVIKSVAPYDFPLLAAVVLLLGTGAVMVYSATINEMTQLTGRGTAKLETHLLHIGLAVLAMLAATFFPYRRLRAITYPALFVTVLVLGLVIVAGVEAGNARRWLALPGFNFQPAELAKLVFVLFLAHSITKKAGNIRKFTVAFIPHFMVCALLILLCLFQPDFGTSVVLVVLMFTLLFVAGTRISYVALFVFVGGFLAFQAIASNDMRLGRVLAAIDPWAHRMGRGYQMVNSQIAIGSGGVTGQGLGYGGQTITGHLPEGETDFILSVLGEQLGSLGILFIAVLFGIILYRGMKIATRCEDAFGRFLAFGITLLIVLEAVINMLVAVALIPTKGLTLPFVSYGGSSLLVSCAAIGVLLNISRSLDWAQARQALPILDAIEAEARRPTPSAPGGAAPSRPRVQVPTTRWERLKARFKKKKPQSVDEVLP
ncbi:MAG: putative lipid II flippase FtsW [Deltaproteobacteria bacterium]|nr:putative lipid II flippase FtsW [Deltaproteobacteria bacterium]